jgi:hypothetical protein
MSFYDNTGRGLVADTERMTGAAVEKASKE